jgi:hypothetical protein
MILRIFEVLTAVLLKIQVLSAATLCSTDEVLPATTRILASILNMKLS